MLEDASLIKNISRFPSHALAALAQYWVSDYYLRQHEYVNAELNYQILSQNTNTTVGDLRYQSRLMAAKSAFFRQAYSDARAYLTNLYNDPGCPLSLLPEVLFVLGDIELDEPTTSSTNNLAKFANAIVPFERITRLFPTNRLEPLARGRIANCHFLTRM